MLYDFMILMILMGVSQVMGVSYPKSCKSVGHFSIETTMVTTGDPLIALD